VENLVEHNSDFDNIDLPIEMTDKISGMPRLGVWYKGFTMRRWEQPALGRNEEGTITTMRPMLDYSLSWIDEEEKIRFDSAGVVGMTLVLRPYMPHTTGPAGMFYQERIDSFLEEEQTANPR
jgi:hypothetical protein